MLKHKLVQAVPLGAVNMGFVKNNVISPKRNIALLDFSVNIPENYDAVGRDMVGAAEFETGAASTVVPLSTLSRRSIILSYHAVQRPDVKKPIRLYYKHEVGAGARQNRYSREYVVIANDVSTTVASDIRSVDDGGRFSIFRSMELLNEDGTPAIDINWDIRLSDKTWTDRTLRFRGVHQTDADGVLGFFVDIYTDKPAIGKTYLVRYTARSTETNEILVNHTEVLNPRAIPFSDQRFEWSKQTTAMTSLIMTRCSLCPGFYIGGMSGDATPLNPDENLVRGMSVYKTNDLAYKFNSAVNPPTVILGSDTYVLPRSTGASLSWEDLASDINQLNLEGIVATPHSLYRNTTYFFDSGTDDITKDGLNVMAFKGGYPGDWVGNFEPKASKGIVIHYKHREDRRIFVKRPVDRSPLYPWFARVNAGEYVRLIRTVAGNDRTYLEPRYTVPEMFTKQEWSGNYGPNVREVVDEPAELVGKHVIQLKRYPIHDISSIKLERNGRVVSQPRDVDIANGKLFYVEDLSTASDLSVSYAYKDNCFDYPDINLNPIDNPDLVGKYVGFYIVPSEVIETTGTYAADVWAGATQTKIYPTASEYEITSDASALSTGIVNLEFYNLQINKHTDALQKLYIDITDDASSLVVKIYNNLSKGITDLVASGAVDLTAGVYNGYVLLTEYENSGLCGKFYLGWGTGWSDTMSAIYQILDTRQAIYHYVADTVEDIETYVATQFSIAGHAAVQAAQLLAVMHVNNSIAVEDVNILDTRGRGGGLFDHVDPIPLEESRMNYDIGSWDGEPFQSAGSIVVEASDYDFGETEPVGTMVADPTGWMNTTGYLTEDEVRDKIKKYIAAGIYPIMDFRGSGE